MYFIVSVVSFCRLLLISLMLHRVYQSACSEEKIYSFSSSLLPLLPLLLLLFLFFFLLFLLHSFLPLNFPPFFFSSSSFFLFPPPPQSPSPQILSLHQNGCTIVVQGDCSHAQLLNLALFATVYCIIKVYIYIYKYIYIYIYIYCVCVCVYVCVCVCVCVTLLYCSC